MAPYYFTCVHGAFAVGDVVMYDAIGTRAHNIVLASFEDAERALFRDIRCAGHVYEVKANCAFLRTVGTGDNVALYATDMPPHLIGRGDEIEYVLLRTSRGLRAIEPRKASFTLWCEDVPSFMQGSTQQVFDLCRDWLGCRILRVEHLDGGVEVEFASLDDAHEALYAWRPHMQISLM